MVLFLGFGYSDVENDVPCTPDTVFRIASISKAITMATVAKLYEEGKLDLDKPVQHYVSSFPEKFVDGQKVLSAQTLLWAFPFISLLCHYAIDVPHIL